MVFPFWDTENTQLFFTFTSFLLFFLHHLFHHQFPSSAPFFIAFFIAISIVLIKVTVPSNCESTCIPFSHCHLSSTERYLGQLLPFFLLTEPHRGRFISPSLSHVPNLTEVGFFSLSLSHAPNLTEVGLLYADC